MKLFTQDDYQTLYSLCFREGYPGYKPEVLEAPNADGKVDVAKRYAHVALKYQEHTDQPGGVVRDVVRGGYLMRAHAEACRVAGALGVPEALFPDLRYSALRILDYPPGATSALHTDFDLLTLNLYRNVPGVLADKSTRFDQRAVHLGEIAEILHIGPAVPHEVPAQEVWQGAIVFFAIPDHAAVLPSGQTVGQWLMERMARSRVPRG